jgi:NADH dehydrogenase
VLVTGASGFIGSSLVPALVEAGHRPRLLLRREPAPGEAPADREVVVGDLAKPETLTAAAEGCDAVVHLGAATSAGRLRPEVARQVNVEGARALIDACLSAGCSRAIVMSTQHVHLETPGLYGETKRAADALFEASGLAVTALRPSLVYGRGTRGVFVRLASLADRLPVVPVLGPGNMQLRPVYLPDLIQIVIAVLARPELAGRTYDVGGPDVVSYVEFVDAIRRALGKAPRRVHLPLGISYALAAVLERVLPNPPLTTENVRGASVEAPCDLTALLRDLAPNLTPLERGLRATFADRAARATRPA